MKFTKIEDFDNIDFDKIDFNDGFMERFKLVMDISFGDMHSLDDRLKKELPDVSDKDRNHAILVAYNLGLRRGFILHSNPPKPERKKFLGIF